MRRGPPPRVIPKDDSRSIFCIDQILTDMKSSTRSIERVLASERDHPRLNRSYSHSSESNLRGGKTP